jgi:dGTPase
VALGHDIGHPPFGHDGERFLSELCREAGIGCFYHSVQSVQFLDRVERKGRGWNLCLQTLDGILCHDGEIHDRSLSPDKDKTFRRLDDELADKRADPTTRLTPMTLEGCVVRFADTIGYIGRDVEDAIRMGMIDRSDLPASATAVLGETNGTIVFNLVTDLIESSFEQPSIAFSESVSEALRALKAFNLDRIYLNPRLKAHVGVIRDLFRRLFDQYLTDLYRNNRASSLYTGFFDGMSPDYLETHSDPEIVRDFIAGMTDQYFLRQCPPDRVAKLPTG